MEFLDLFEIKTDAESHQNLDPPIFSYGGKKVPCTKYQESGIIAVTRIYDPSMRHPITFETFDASMPSMASMASMVSMVSMASMASIVSMVSMVPMVSMASMVSKASMASKA